jgi:preprotein translocase subunit SecG
MASMVPYLILALLLVVAVILGMGLLNMARGGSMNRSQTLMRYRVAAQFIAVIAMVAALFFFGRG